jgi:hypothetical protein
VEKEKKLVLNRKDATNAILQDIYKPTVVETKIMHAEVIDMLSGKSLMIPEE